MDSFFFIEARLPHHEETRDHPPRAATFLKFYGPFPSERRRFHSSPRTKVLPPTRRTRSPIPPSEVFLFFSPPHEVLTRDFPLPDRRPCVRGEREYTFFPPRLTTATVRDDEDSPGRVFLPESLLHVRPMEGSAPLREDEDGRVFEADCFQDGFPFFETYAHG